MTSNLNRLLDTAPTGRRLLMAGKPDLAERSCGDLLSVNGEKA